MKQKLRILRLLLLALAAGLTSSAQEVGKDGVNYQLNESGRTATVTGCYGGGHIVIADKIPASDGGSDYTVTSIRKKAFRYSGIEEITFPSTLKEIGDSAFFGCSGLKEISFPQSLLTIGDEAFTGCTGLYNVSYTGTPKLTSIGSLAFKNCPRLISFTIPASVREIGVAPFSLCKNLTKLFFLPNTSPETGGLTYDRQHVSKRGTDIDNAEYLGYIEYKGKYYFYYDRWKDHGWLNPYNSKTKVKPIVRQADPIDIIYNSGDYQFISSLFSVNGVRYVPISVSERTCDVVDCEYGRLSEEMAVPSTVEYKGVSLQVKNIAPYSFYKSYGVKNISISNDGYIGKRAFYKSVDLNSADISNAGDIQEEAFRNCAVLQKAVVKNNGNVGVMAFYGDSALSSLIVENNGNIADSAFSQLSSLPEVSVNNNGTIGKYAFYNNPSLKNVTINNNGGIQTGAFSKNDSLQLVKIYSKGNIGEKAFSYDPSLTQVDIYNKGYIGERAFYASGSYSNTMSAKIGPDVTGIKVAAFYSSALNGIVIPDNVTYIDSVAFMDCSRFSFVTIGKGLKRLSSHLFQECPSLPEITIPANIKDIREDAFTGCSGLARVFIEDSNEPLKLSGKYVTNDTGSDFITSGEYVDENGSLASGKHYERLISCNALFEDCRLDTVYVGRTLEYPGYSKYNPSASSTVYAGEINGYPLNVTVPKSKSPFQNSGLSRIGLSDRVKAISAYMFSGCNRLEQIYLSDTITFVGNYAFDGCASLSHARLSNEITAVGEGTFRDCTSLGSIFIPKKVTSIGNFAFNSCVSLKLFVAEDSKALLKLGYGNYSDINTDIDGQGLFATAGLDSIYVGRPITYPTDVQYGYSPFYRHESLRAVELGDYEKLVQDNEFYGCRALQSVTIGDGIKSIGDRAFSDCPQLKYFAFGMMVKSVGKEAFSDCTAMTTLIAQTPVPPTCGPQALDDINKWECTLYVPAGLDDKYKNAEYWKEFFFISHAPDATYSIDLTPAPDGKSYAAAYLPFSVQGQAEGSTKFYFASQPIEGKVYLQPVKDSWMPAHTGYIVIDESGAKKATLTIRYSDPIGSKQENALRGCLNDSTITDAASSVYVLGVDNDIESFVRPNSNVMEANTAFLPSAVPLRFLVFSFDDIPTGIENIIETDATADDNAPVYDLSGRRVYGILPQGVYIKRGQKFYVK